GWTPSKGGSGRERPEMKTHSAPVGALGLVVVHEVLGWIGSPDVEGILRRVVGGFPVEVGRDKVDAGRIFAIAAPGIADIMEIVRSEDMPSKAPAPAVAFAEHMGRADADLVDAADVPAQMVEAGRIRFRERHHVMVAAVDAVEEGDAVPRMVGDPHPEYSCIEVHRLAHVAGEHEHMGESP